LVFIDDKKLKQFWFKVALVHPICGTSWHFATKSQSNKRRMAGHPFLVWAAVGIASFGGKVTLHGKANRNLISS
jgi:hypothetical protein